MLILFKPLLDPVTMHQALLLTFTRVVIKFDLELSPPPPRVCTPEMPSHLHLALKVAV